jgi:two-component system NarL family sensor kinase
MPSNQTELHYTFFATLTVLTIIFCVSAFSIIYHFRKKRKQLRAKSFQDEYGMEADRKRIAADLHDDFGSLLTGLRLSLNELARREPSNSLFTSSSEQLNVSMLRLREISLNLLPRELENEGLSAAIESMVERLNQSNQIRVNFSTAVDVKHFDKQKAMLLFRVIQEITTNAIKNSGAGAIDIGIAQRNSHLILEIRDDGCGFDYETAYKKKNSSGLKNIQSRLDLLNAILIVESAAGRGTHYFINIPLKHLTHGN